MQHGRHKLRVLYSFDPRRQAVLLIGGDKTGNDRFYEEMVPKAERLSEQYQEDEAAGLHDKRRAEE